MGNLNLCIVTHGLTLRLFLMRWLQFSVDEFEVISSVFLLRYLKVALPLFFTVFMVASLKN